MYRFIELHCQDFGLRWLLRRMQIYPNAYCSYLRRRKADYDEKRQMVLSEIKQIYHEHKGVDGYRTMRVYLERRNIHLSALTVHRYMNRELGLQSIVRRKKPGYQQGTPHRVFDNLLQQGFYADGPNQKWCTDFTYLFLADGSTRYNCSIIDLFDRSIVSSMTDRSITSDLAVRTLQKALQSQRHSGRGILLHSDQGSQFASIYFTQYCAACGIIQSMSRAGQPCDNAPMERYFNTLKCEEIYLHHYRTEEELNRAVEEFAYGWYNHVRAHSYNDYKTPYQARHGA